MIRLGFKECMKDFMKDYKSMKAVLMNQPTLDRVQLMNDTHRCFIIAADLAKQIASGKIGYERNVDIEGMMQACRNLERALYRKHRCLTRRDMDDLMLAALSIGSGMIAVMDEREAGVLERMGLGWVNVVMSCMKPRE